MAHAHHVSPSPSPRPSPPIRPTRTTSPPRPRLQTENGKRTPSTRPCVTSKADPKGVSRERSKPTAQPQHHIQNIPTSAANLNSSNVYKIRPRISDRKSTFLAHPSKPTGLPRLYLSPSRAALPRLSTVESPEQRRNRRGLFNFNLPATNPLKALPWVRSCCQSPPHSPSR